MFNLYFVDEIFQLIYAKLLSFCKSQWKNLPFTILVVVESISLQFKQWGESIFLQILVTPHFKSRYNIFTVYAFTRTIQSELPSVESTQHFFFYIYLRKYKSVKEIKR